MNIIVLNKSKAQRLSYTDYSTDKVIISIRNPIEAKALFNADNNTIRNILYLDFYDISYETQDIFKGYHAISDDDAVKIRDFVLKWKDKADTIWVQCDMGMSRSAGIAAGILKAFGEDNSFILESKMYYPNMLCYHKMLKAFKIE